MKEEELRSILSELSEKRKEISIQFHDATVGLLAVADTYNEISGEMLEVTKKELKFLERLEKEGLNR